MRSASTPALSLCAIGTGGSSGRTIACIESALRARGQLGAMTFIDTQPFNLRTGGLTAYPGTGRVVLAQPRDCGLRMPTGSWTANLLLSGGALAYRRLVIYARSILESGRPDVLLLCHDRIYIETAFVRAARALGIPTILVQEGPFCAIGHSKANNWKLRVKQWMAPTINGLGIVPSIPDYGFAGHEKVLAASEGYRRKWIDAGLAPERVQVAGIPRYDFLAGMQGLTGTPRVPRLLYLVQPFAAHGKVDPRAANILLEQLGDALNLLADEMPFELIVRAHPRSGGDDIGALRSRLKTPPRPDDSAIPVEKSIQQSDVVIGHYSSGLLESLIIGKPIVCLPIPLDAFAEREEASKQHWLTQVGAPVASEAATIRAAILRMLQPDAVIADRSLLAEEVGTIDGRSAARCAEAIVELATRRRHR